MSLETWFLLNISLGGKNIRRQSQNIMQSRGSADCSLTQHIHRAATGNSACSPPTDPAPLQSFLFSLIKYPAVTQFSQVICIVQVCMYICLLSASPSSLQLIVLPPAILPAATEPANPLGQPPGSWWAWSPNYPTHLASQSWLTHRV